MEEIKEIERVIFIPDKKAAYIFYLNQTMEYVSINEGKKAATTLVQQDKVGKDELKNYTKIEFLNSEDLKIKYGKEIEDRKAFARHLLNKKTISNSRVTERIHNKRKHSRANSLVTAGIFITVGCILAGGYNIYNRLFNNDKEISKENEDNNNSLETNSKIASNKVMSILNKKEVNKTRRKFLSSVFEYLYNYNYNFSKNHGDNTTDTKAAHRWDEIVSQVLVYKNYDKQQTFDIFGYYDYDSNIMYKAFNDGLKQEEMAHIIQKEPLKKTFLNNKTGEIYNKYEALNIRFNNQISQEGRIETANIFFSELRNDIDFDEGKISDKMIVISPILEAMMKKTKGSKLDERLNSKELEFYRSFCDETAREKLQEIDNKLEEVVILNKNLGVVETSTYEEIEDTAMEQLEESNLYNVAEDQRDISDHKDYKEAISHFKNDNSKTEINTVSNEISSNSEEKTTSDINNDNDNKKEIKKKKKSEKTVDKSTKSKKNNDSSEEDSSNYEDDNYDDDYYDNEQDDINNNDNNDNNNDDDNEYIDYDENKEDNDDNLSNSSVYGDHIKDITTDPSGAVDHNEPLPDPNSKVINKLTIEQIANQAIEYAANNIVSEQVKNNKVLIK